MKEEVQVIGHWSSWFDIVSGIVSEFLAIESRNCCFQQKFEEQKSRRRSTDPRGHHPDLVVFSGVRESLQVLRVLVVTPGPVNARLGILDLYLYFGFQEIYLAIEIIVDTSLIHFFLTHFY